MRLLATDQEGVEVVSSLMQDAVVRIGDIVYSKKKRELVLGMNRFCWEHGKRQVPARNRSALQVRDVLNMRTRNIAQTRKNGVLNLLAVTFMPASDALGSDTIGGELRLQFSDRAELLLQVECLDLALVDVSGPWGTKKRPRHDLA